jgi:hypothetical protein
LPVLLCNEYITLSNNLIVVFYLKRLTKYNIRTFNRPANCQISYRLLKFKGLKFPFLLSYIEGRSLDLIFNVCFCLVVCNSTPLSRKLHFPINCGFVDRYFMERMIQSESRLDNGVVLINLSRTFFTGIGHVLEYIDQVLKIHSF